MTASRPFVQNTITKEVVIIHLRWISRRNKAVGNSLSTIKANACFIFGRGTKGMFIYNYLCNHLRLLIRFIAWGAIHSFVSIRMLFLWPMLNILIFLPILGWRYSCIILINCSLSLFRFRMSVGYKLLLMPMAGCFFFLLTSFTIKRKE